MCSGHKGLDRPALAGQAHLYPSSAQLFAQLQPSVHHPLQVPLQPPAKVSEHGGTSRQHDVLLDTEDSHSFSKPSASVIHNKYTSSV